MRKIILLAILPGIVCLLFTVQSSVAEQLKMKQIAEPVVDNGVQFDGEVNPGKVFVLSLKPGEEVVDLAVKEGQQIKQGDVVAHLFNERLYTLHNNCIDKEITFSQMGYSLKKLQNSLTARIDEKNEIAGRLKKMQELSAKGIDTGLSNSTFQLKGEKRKLEFEIESLHHDINREQDTMRRLAPSIERSTVVMQAVQQKIDELKIKSAFSGVVKNVHQQPGRTQAGDVLLEIWDEAHLVIDADVSQDHIEALKVGSIVQIYSDYYSNNYQDGTVTYIGDGKKRSNGSGQGWTFFPVKIHPKSQIGLRIGNQVIVKAE